MGAAALPGWAAGPPLAGAAATGATPATPAQARATAPPAAATPGGILAPVGTGGIFCAGYQAGFWAGGLHNIAAYGLDLGRSVQQAGGTVGQQLAWPSVFQGVFLRGVYADENHFVSLGWSNRHTIAEMRYTDAKGQEYRTEYRTRLNEVSIELGALLYHARLRPGVGADIGLFRASTRTTKGGESADAWHSIHFDNPNDGLLAPGRLSPTAGVSLFCDVAPFGKAGGGLTFRPFYQWHIMQPDLFGTYNTGDSSTYQYRANNYGLSLSWAFSSLKP